MGFSRLGYSIGLNCMVWQYTNYNYDLIYVGSFTQVFEVQVLGFSHAFYVDAPNNSRSVFT